MEENKDLDIRKQDELLYSLEKVDTYINKSYLSKLFNYKITEQFPVVEDNTKLIIIETHIIKLIIFFTLFISSSPSFLIIYHHLGR